MKKYLTLLLGVLLSFILPQLKALHRDYPSYTDSYSDPWLEQKLFPFCYSCGITNFVYQWDDLPSIDLSQIPNTGPECKGLDFMAKFELNGLL